MKMFAQNEDEANQMKEAGFTNIEVLKEEGTLFGDIKLIKTPAKHYSDASIVELFRQLNTADEACGVVFEDEDEKTLYVTITASMSKTSSKETGNSTIGLFKCWL